ncbi:hypothetical protein, partial [Pseudomonas aeruginosa]|uniref:hypothetical protein n=1 Tax=Pseudomonas aeruginosa TaxID=287 RepID=UPI001CD9E09A
RSVKRYFRKFSFLLNRLRRPSNHLPISGRRILQRSNSLSSTSVKLRFEPLSGPNRCGGQPAGALHHPWEIIRKSLIFKHLLFVVAGSGGHYREIETGVNTYLKLFNPKVRKPRGRPIPPL